jgi:hypothetical protein
MLKSKHIKKPFIIIIIIIIYIYIYIYISLTRNTTGKQKIYYSCACSVRYKFFRKIYLKNFSNFIVASCDNYCVSKKDVLLSKRNKCRNFERIRKYKVLYNKQLKTIP